MAREEISMQEFYGNAITAYKTCELVQALTQREGVDVKIAEPYQDVSVSINGPAVVLIVID